MLANLIHYLATPAPLAIRRAGHVSAAVALWSRARRHASAWANHEARTRAAIDAAIDRTHHRRVAVVLGSGLLRDIPIDRLRAVFREVVLVDVVHLASVRLAARVGRWDTVAFETRDLSGLDDLFERERIGRSIGGDIGAPLDPLGFLRRMDEVDLVVSANLLSQILVGAARRLSRERRYARMPSDTLARLAAAHLQGLATLEARTVLVTDTACEIRDRTGAVLERRDLLAGVALPEPAETWEWPVAPFGEEARDRERVHRVVVVHDHAQDLV